MLCETILVVEDDEAIRDVVRFALESRGYTVETATDGIEGLKTLKHFEKPCLILLDLMMPIMDGWTFAHIVENDPQLKNYPLVVLTAATDGLEEIKSKGILKKPIDVNELYHVAQLYANSRSGRTYARA